MKGKGDPNDWSDGVTIMILVLLFFSVLDSCIANGRHQSVTQRLEIIEALVIGGEKDDR